MGSERHGPPDEVATVSGNGAAAAQLDTERSRRALLKGLGVAAAGAVVGGVLSPEEAQAHGTFHADSNNADPAIHGNNTAFGPGVQADSSGGAGVQASGGIFGVDASSGNTAVRAQGGGVGVFANSVNGTGVFAFSNNVGVEAAGNPGMKASSSTGIGVDALSESGTAVQAVGGNVGVDASSDNIGVNASGGFIGVTTSGEDVGVDASSDNIGVNAGGGNFGVLANSADGTGVRAQTNTGTALDVFGPARFSTAGAGTIPANQNSVVVSNPAVTANSHITMTYTGNPGVTSSGTFAAVVWVERQPGIGFTARLSRRVTNATPFTYLIVEPG